MRWQFVLVIFFCDRDKPPFLPSSVYYFIFSLFIILLFFYLSLLFLIIAFAILLLHSGVTVSFPESPKHLFSCLFWVFWFDVKTWTCPFNKVNRNEKGNFKFKKERKRKVYFKTRSNLLFFLIFFCSSSLASSSSTTIPSVKLIWLSVKKNNKKTPQYI